MHKMMNIIKIFVGLAGNAFKMLLGLIQFFLVLKSEETVALFRGISRCWMVIANGLSKDYAQLLLLKFFIYFSSILTLALGQCFWVE